MNSITNTLRVNKKLNSKFFDPVNTNVIGKMKDEFKRKNN